MIGRLSGIVAEIREGALILDVGGVGYLVAAHQRLLMSLGAGDAARLEIETVVREDAIRLFGFAERAEKDWFNLLQEVQGVGSKVALAILSVLTVDDLAAAIARQDHAALARAQGVGPKLAKRIAAELKDKAPARDILIRLPKGGAASPAGPAPADPARLRRADAVSALVNLGYAPGDAAAAIDAAAARLGGLEELPTLIREGLKALSER